MVSLRPGACGRQLTGSDTLSRTGGDLGRTTGHTERAERRRLADPRPCPSPPMVPLAGRIESSVVGAPEAQTGLLQVAHEVESRHKVVGAPARCVVGRRPRVGTPTIRGGSGRERRGGAGSGPTRGVRLPTGSEQRVRLYGGLMVSDRVSTTRERPRLTGTPHPQGKPHVTDPGTLWTRSHSRTCVATSSRPFSALSFYRRSVHP